METSLPPLSTELIAALDRLFPLINPDPSWPDREIWIRVGHRRVVDFLKTVKANQDSNLAEMKLVQEKLQKPTK